MPIYPGSVYKRPPGMTVGAKRKKTDAAILHIDAGGVRDLYGWWNNPDSGANGSHFQVAYDGTVVQYADTDFIVYTSGSGSQRSVGIETQGKAAGEWTPAQRTAIVNLLAWLCKIYNLPVRQMTSSKKSERGIGYHLLGVPANAAQKAAKVSQTGGELWSSSVGKVCPGPDRVKQIPSIVNQVATGTPNPTPPEEDDMPTVNEFFNTPVTKGPDGKTDVTLAQTLTSLWVMANRNYDETPGRVWNFPLEHTVAKTADGKPLKVAAGTLLQYEPAEHESTRKTLIEAITKAVAGIPGVDQAGLEKAISGIVQDSLANSRIVFVPAPELEKASDNA